MGLNPRTVRSDVRLVLDTNVVVSALIWGGEPYRLIRAAAQGDIELCTSAALLDELLDVLGRPHLSARLAAQRSSVEQAVALYGELAVTVITPSVVPRVVASDADDDHVVAAAVAARAELIVSGDRHLLGLLGHQGIDIVRVGEALARIAPA